MACLAAIAISGLTWALAARARTPDELASRAKPPAPSRITVPIKWERLTRSIHVQCSAEATSRVSITADSTTEPIVTGTPIKKGAKVAEGKPVLEIASRPVIIIQGRLPAFRDLRPGLTGPDVKQLQRAFARLGLLSASRVSGVFDRATRSAVTRFYKYAGYPLPAQSQGTQDSSPPPADSKIPVTVPRHELLVVHQLPARLGTLTTKIGAKLHSGDAVVESGRLRLRCLPDVEGDVKLKIGASATVTSSVGRSLSGEVSGLREPARDDDQKPADHASVQPGQARSSASPVVYLRVGSGLKHSRSYQADIVVERAAHTGAVVPSSALWERPGGRTVVIVRRGDQERDVAVDPGLEIDGEVEILGNGLQEGDQVVVSDANLGAGSP
jgi:putative peptidoglycan binding protein